MMGLPSWALWLILCGVFLLIEIFNVSFLLIWPGIGAFFAFIANILGFDITVQIGVFVITTTLMIIFMKPLTNKLFKNKDDTKMNNMSIIGKKGIVVSNVDNLSTTGQVKVSGELWSAIPYTNDETIKVGENVIVKDIQGVKLKVQKIDKL